MRLSISGILILITLVFSATLSTEHLSAQGNSGHDTLPKAIDIERRGRVMIGENQVNYNVNVGRMEVLDDDGKVMALFGHTSYTEQGRNAQRPIVFAFNGGPGSSSVWLHMGALGPKRVRVNDPNPTPNAPYTIEDNSRSLLDVADLVMIDPVGTGISVPMGKKEGKDFWGVDEDIESISAFIKQYLIAKGRMNSPKYLLGESYGTFRNAGIMNHLQNQGIAFNGVIMVSAVFDLLPLTFPNDNDLAYIVHLPTYASTAWYHEKLENRPESLETFLDEVRKFTEEVYSPALFKGDRLSGDERNVLAAQLAKYTGTGSDFWLRANFRVKASEFFSELLRDEGALVGRLDSRYRGINQRILSQIADHDPFISSLSTPYTTAFLDYYYRELGMDPTIVYSISAYGKKGFKWNWEHAGNTSWNTTTAITTAPDMARTLSRNPYTKVLIMNGYYDLGTPFYAVEHTVNHLNLKPELRDNIKMTYYKAGHMMYTDEQSFDAFAKDIRDFIRETSNTK